MSILDLAKATVVCGGLAFLVCTYPALGQVLLLAVLGLLWLLYARKTMQSLRRH